MAKDITPTPAMIKAIATETRKHLAIGVCAQAQGITPYHLAKIMKQGAEDANDLQDTPFSKFYITVRVAQAEKAKELLQDLEDEPKKWQAISWKLQACMREEFGTEAKEYKELLEASKKLMEDVVKHKQSTQGVLKNGESKE